MRLRGVVDQAFELAPLLGMAARDEIDIPVADLVSVLVGPARDCMRCMSGQPAGPLHSSKRAWYRPIGDPGAANERRRRCGAEAGCRYVRESTEEQGPGWLTREFRLIEGGSARQKTQRGRDRDRKGTGRYPPRQREQASPSSREDPTNDYASYGNESEGDESEAG